MAMLTRPVRSGSLIILLVSAWGCGPSGFAPGETRAVDPLQASRPAPAENTDRSLTDEYDRNLARWGETGITRYAFTYAPFCFCPSAPRLIVSDGDQVRIDGTPIGAINEPPGLAPAGVPGLFLLVREAIDGESLTVTYDSTTGIPVRMVSDPARNVSDDELSFEVRGWTLEPPDDQLVGHLSDARRTWEEAQIWSYDWSIRIDCECINDGKRFDIMVRNGDVHVSSRGDPVTGAKLEGIPTTIETFFDMAAVWVARPGSTATFDAELGYPMRVIVGPDPNVAGQAVAIRVLAFEPRCEPQDACGEPTH